MPLHCAHILQSFLLCFLLHSGNSVKILSSSPRRNMTPVPFDQHRVTISNQTVFLACISLRPGRNLGKQAKPLTLRSRSDSKARRSRPSDLAERTKGGVSDSCSVEGCTRFAMVRGSLNGAEQFCGRHRSKCIGSPILRKGLCEASNCSTQATFGSMLDKTRRRCAEHRDPEDTYLVGGGRKCEAEGCFLQPTFGDQTSSRPRFCRQHRSDNHQVVGYASCSVSSCSRRAMYLPANSSTPDACFKHKNTSHTHIFKRCQHPACSNRALFVTRGVDGSGRARKRKCAEHRSNGDVSLGSVVTRRGCQFPEGCTAEPSFGDRLTHVRLFCAPPLPRYTDPCRQGTCHFNLGRHCAVASC